MVVGIFAELGAAKSCAGQPPVVGRTRRPAPRLGARAAWLADLALLCDPDQACASSFRGWVGGHALCASVRLSLESAGSVAQRASRRSSVPTLCLLAVAPRGPEVMGKGSPWPLAPPLPPWVRHAGGGRGRVLKQRGSRRSRAPQRRGVAQSMAALPPALRRFACSGVGPKPAKKLQE